ncbi:alpha/beta hydrolase [Massilia agilis]|uniref:Alpha/beta hydrolase n=1 Tax=Massilia agilis TaxID=1811226 RepID=A0ABT2D8W1_9BURK|nr:alpha/beta hydrolase [Massilia agilis]MCS0807720.1 alpha/beta hydrolase [Massilia agilis]
MNKASLLFALAVAVAAPSFAAEPAPPANPYAMRIAPAERFDVGPLRVERHGSGGRALVLIPGLASGAWVWQDVVRAFSGQQAVYVVTLPGFDGRDAAPSNLAAVRKALGELIVARSLDKPVLVGHSLGGMLALAVAEDSPGLVGGVVAVDGLPVLPGTEGYTPEQRAAALAQAGSAQGQYSKEQFAAGQQAYMSSEGVLDMTRADMLAELTSRSDPAAVRRAVADALALDLRPGLSRISAPILEISPYFAADQSQVGITEQAKLEFYKSLLAGAPKVEVVSISPARHFVMFDQPAKLLDALRTFLSKLGG